MPNSESARCDNCLDILKCKGMSTSGLLRHFQAKHSILTEKSTLEVDSNAKICKLDSQPKITSALCQRESIEEIVAN